jgi:DNA-binding protein YbaB
MSPDQRIRELYAEADRTMAQLKARVASIQQAQQQAMRARGEATSQDGSVHVVVDATGVVTSLRFADSVFERTTPERLAQTVVATIQSAAAQARGRMAAALPPADGETSAKVAEGLAALGIPKFGVPAVPRTAADPTAQDAFFEERPAASFDERITEPEPEPAPQPAPPAEPQWTPRASKPAHRTAQSDSDGGEDWATDERPW